MVGVADVNRMYGICRLVALLYQAMEQPRARVLTSAKPPNILLLHDSKRSNDGGSSDKQNALDYQQAKADLATCIGHERYVIYPLALEDVSQLPWQENCQLLIAPAHLNLAGSTPNVIQHLRSYVGRGGKCLSMNPLLSDALVSGVDEVREGSAAVAITSELCHIIPCIKEEEGLESFVASSLHPKQLQCGAAQLKEEKDLVYTPLGRLHQPGAEVNDTPLPLHSPTCVHLVSDQGGQTQYVSSTVELLPSSFKGLTVSMVSELKQSTPARHVFLRAVLHQLGIECSPSPPPSLSYTFLFTATDEVSDKGSSRSDAC